MHYSGVDGHDFLKCYIEGIFQVIMFPFQLRNQDNLLVIYKPLLSWTLQIVHSI